MLFPAMAGKPVALLTESHRHDPLMTTADMTEVFL